MLVHVLGVVGEAKIWIEPRIMVARSCRLPERTLSVALELIREREDDIRKAWNQHFGS